MSEPRPVPSRRELVRGGAATAVAATALATLPTAATAQRPSVSMRSTDRPRTLTAALPAPPDLGVIVHNRCAFGPRPGDVAAFQALGSDDTGRLTAWVDQQLAPGSIPDVDVDNRLSAAGFTTLGKSLTELWADHVVANPPWEVRMQPLWETRAATWIRAVYSERQLLEVLASFWHDHFSVFGPDYWIGPVFVHYDRDIIRAHALGNFRTFLEAVATSNAMLYYLDNYTSSDAGPNENFARELFELHAMGAENYLGVMSQQDVPLDGNGIPVGYVDGDVFEATRAFTGWTISNDSNNPDVGNTGEFHYRADWHDRFQKYVLGEFIPSDQPPLKDGRDVLDRLANHPGTARHIAGKLCRRLLGDDPPQSIIDQAATVFAGAVAAPDQIAQTVRTILLSTEFQSTWADKIKRPFDIVASALRAGQADFPFVLGDSDYDSFSWRFSQTGQEPFTWRAPNGFPDHRDAWTSASPRVMSWRMVNWLVDVTDDSDNFYLDVLAQTPAGVRSATELVDFWIDRIHSRTLPAGERAELIDFMAQGYNPTFDLPLDTDDDIQERLRSLIGLMFMSPSFLWR
ncbi:MAG: DUF1800 domain-containing protein [Acidobacteriota bacterium]